MLAGQGQAPRWQEAMALDGRQAAAAAAPAPPQYQSGELAVSISTMTARELALGAGGKCERRSLGAWNVGCIPVVACGRLVHPCKDPNASRTPVSNNHRACSWHCIAVGSLLPCLLPTQHTQALGLVLCVPSPSPLLTGEGSQAKLLDS